MSNKDLLASIEYKLFRFFETEDAAILDGKFTKLAGLEVHDPKYIELEKYLKGAIAALARDLVKE